MRYALLLLGVMTAGCGDTTTVVVAPTPFPRLDSVDKVPPAGRVSRCVVIRDGRLLCVDTTGE